MALLTRRWCKFTRFAYRSDMTVFIYSHKFVPPLKLSRNGTSVNSGPVTFTWINTGGFAQAVSDGLLSSTTMDLRFSYINIS